jgi:hypothetical protein
MQIPRFVWLVLTLLAVHVVLREAKIERATLRQSLAIFPTILSFRILFFLGPPMFLYGAYQIAKTAHTFVDWFLVGILAVFAFLSVWLERGTTIRVSDKGVLFRRWYGLKKCDIPWKDVRSAVSAKVPKTVAVFSADGRSIVHTQWHVDPSTFELVLARRLGAGLIRQ